MKPFLFHKEHYIEFKTLSQNGKNYGGSIRFNFKESDIVRYKDVYGRLINL